MLTELEWAHTNFSKCDLGDKRRTKRLIQMASHLAGNVGRSIVKSSPQESDVEGSYRLIRNKNVDANAIAEGAFQASAEQAKSSQVLLALEDTTSLAYQHSVANELSYTSSAQSGSTKGFFVHSVMLFDPIQEATLGLIEQRRWIRDESKFGKRKVRATTPYEEKESFKWQQASENMHKRLGSEMAKCISVCDREADIIEYLDYKQQHGHRFVVRAKSNRPLSNDQRLYDYASELAPAGTYQVAVAQKGGRKARQANMEVKFAQVEVKAPARKQQQYQPIKAHVVLCNEISESESPLTWVLLTTEVLNSKEDALKIVKYYEARWKIEEFHKVWKSEGTQVENLRMQHADNLERAAVILAFVAIRLYQLKEQGDKSDAAQVSCETCLSTLQWKLLWKKRHKQKALPKQPPSMKWAYQSLGRLGGWKDSKKTGRVSWRSLWDGWSKLESLVEGYQMFQEM